MKHWNPKLRAWMPGMYRQDKIILVLLAMVVLLLGAATQIRLTTQVQGILPIANGGSNTSSTLTGLIRGGSSYTAAELSGDATTSGSNAVTVARVNGTSVGTNAAADQVIVTTASQTASWAAMPNCTAGALQYATSTHTFTCGTVLTGTFADGEVPTGTINGANTSFTLAHTPNPAGSLELIKNGQTLVPGGADFSLATATITMTTAPATGDILVSYYRW
jgi:hypothetical protein